MQNESTVHFGTYGCGDTKAMAREHHRGINCGKAWHSALKPKEITELFITWGIIGKRRPINPVLRLSWNKTTQMPVFTVGRDCNENL